MEYRVYAENPKEKFKPVRGTIQYISRASGPGVLEDGWVESGSRLSAFYDALLSKIVITGRDRAEAVSRSMQCLDEYLVEGVPTTLDFHRCLLRLKNFIEAEFDVGWIERNYRGETRGPKSVGPFSLPPLQAVNT